ncbi:response regulator [Cellulophaga sp. 20_2_10]|uniref:tetratricopeptide repeat-containing hybrid sensor histidine kinase/response regulator n=1 Tax=Cellulophaga sp. 20_2_10 TaxID=2942476 RepID=UPI00201B1AA1|nr:response regulator [Cellulophaga sp. 20_2_10]MCL5244314.1 response regulator [Cellulophaga sp. 20_2_10]
MKKNLFLIFLVCCYSFTVFSQSNLNKVIDSVNILIVLSKEQNLKGNYKDALKYATSAVQYATTKKDKLLQARAYVSLANTYQIIDDTDNAKKYYNIALNKAKNTDNYFVNVASLNGLGNIYSNDFSTADKAAAYFEASIVHALKAGKNEYAFLTYFNIAGMYLNFEDADKAYPYIIKAEEQLTKIDKEKPLNAALLNLNFAIYYKLKKNYKVAANYIEKARVLGEQHKLNRELIDIYDFKHEIHRELGEYDLAIESLKKQYYYKDLNFNAEKNLQIEEVTANFKVNEFKEAAKASKLKTNYIIIVGIGCLLFLSTSFLVFYNYKKRLSFVKLEKKNEALLQAKNEAERANTLKSELLINISHELRTPLYGIVGITNMLIEDKAAKSNQEGLLNSLKFSGDHLKSVVNNILRIHEVESNSVRLEITKVNLHLLLKNIVSSLNYLADQQETQLVLNISKDVLEVYNIDGANLSEILIKLIDNAIKYTKNGVVEVAVNLVKREENKDFIAFKVSDTGVGISKKNLAMIFDNFKQGNSEENTSYGIGLGLPIVRHLIKIMGSTLAVTSNVGKGSQFSFIIECEVLRDDLKIEPVYSKKILNILVVEDNKINQLVTSKLIKSLGYTCTIAKNGLEAVKLCNSNVYDLILMDLNMPVMNGFEASKTIKAKHKDIPIIALTALEISEVKERCQKAGINSITNKPISKEGLEDLIQMNVLD